MTNPADENLTEETITTGVPEQPEPADPLADTGGDTDDESDDEPESPSKDPRSTKRR